MIIPKLLFFKIERKAFRRDAVMLGQSFFSIAPEAFQSVDIYSTAREIFPMIDLKMPISTKHKRIVDLIPVGIDDTAPANFRNRKIHNGFRSYIRNTLHPYSAVSFKNPEHRYLACRASASLALPPAAEVRFIKFNLSRKRPGCIFGMRHYRHPECRNRLERRTVGDAELRSHLTGGHLQFKKLYKPQPIHTVKIPIIDPSTAEIGEAVFAAAASAPAVGQPVQLPVVAAGTNSLMVFKAKSQHVFSGEKLRFYQLFVANQVHDTILARCQTLNNHLS